MTTSVVPDNFRPIDLASAREIISDSLDAAINLNGQACGTNRKDTAEINRQLLHLADDLALASALVRNAYWASRGEDSYEL